MIEIQPVAGPVDATVRLPGSKSLTNRALVCAAMARGKSELHGALASDDTRVMLESLAELGIEVHVQRGGATLEVHGCGGVVPNPSAQLAVGNSGTTIRFLTAALSMAGGTYRLDGVPRMRQRPIGPLIEALEKLGVQIVAESPGGCPPVSIQSSQVVLRHTEIAGDVSSQYLSGLMMGAPLAADGLQITITRESVSWPYVEMTRQVMQSFGVAVELSGRRSASIAADQEYSGQVYQIEPDASAASYFWAVAAICGGTVLVEGLERDSLQGDVRFVEALGEMGCQIDFQQRGIAVSGPAKRGIVVDMSDISDTAQTLAMVALFVQGSTCITGIAHNRVKETDRIGNLAIELRKLGAEVEERNDGLLIHPPSQLQPATIETYDDHRMAMSFALAGLRQAGVQILNPRCVEKTFPDYFSRLAEAVRE